MCLEGQGQCGGLSWKGGVGQMVGHGATLMVFLGIPQGRPLGLELDGPQRAA